MSGKLTSPTRKQGRPRLYATDLPVYDNMGQCEGATGIPKTIMMKANAGGCLAFRNGRVHLGEFLRWHFNPKSLPEAGKSDFEDGEDWSKRDKRAVALTREANLEKIRGAAYPSENVDKFLSHLTGGVFFSELSRMLSELPAVMKGRSELEIHEECRKQEKAIQDAVRSSVASFLAEAKKGAKE